MDVPIYLVDERERHAIHEVVLSGVSADTSSNPHWHFHTGSWNRCVWQQPVYPFVYKPSKECEDRSTPTSGMDSVRQFKEQERTRTSVSSCLTQPSPMQAWLMGPLLADGKKTSMAGVIKLVLVALYP